MTARQVVTWALAGGLLAAAALTLSLNYASMEESGDDCDVYSDSSTGWPIFVSLLAAVLLAFALFVVAKSFAPAAVKRRYLLGLSILLLGAWAVTVIVFPDMTGIHWKHHVAGQWRRNGGLWMFIGPAVLAGAAYALFGLVKSRPFGETAWRWLIAVPFAGLVGMAILFAALVPFIGGAYC